MSRKGCLLYAVLVVLAVPVPVSHLWMVTASLLPANEVLSFRRSCSRPRRSGVNYAQAFRRVPVARQVLQQSYIAATVTAGTMVVASFAGYAFARIRFRARSCSCSSSAGC